MKKLLIAVAACTMALLTRADGGYDYPYMVFTTTDGQQTTVPTDGLQMEFVDGTLKVTSQTGELTLPMDNLAEMHFSETDIATGIESLNVERLTLKDDAFYDLAGRRVKHPAKGLYIVNGKKILVK